MKVLLVVLASFVLLGTNFAHKGAKCLHDEYQKKVKLSLTGTEYLQMPTWKRILTPSVRQFRIFIDYSIGDAWINTVANQGAALINVAKYNYAKRLINTSAWYFQNLTTINSEQTMSVQGILCNNVQFPTTTKDTDLYVMVFVINDGTSAAFATAYGCAQDATTMRRTTGVFELNVAMITNSDSNFLLYMSTFIHEMSHIIYFSQDMFPQYWGGSAIRAANTTVIANQSFIGQTNDLIVAADVVTYAKTFFNIPSLTGLPLENGGGTGSASSHWEKSFFPMEYMNPSVESPGYVTTLSLILMNWSGWYASVNTSFAMPYYWGFGNNNMFNTPCPTSSEYCLNANAVGCQQDYLSKTTCGGFSTFMGTCQYNKNDGHYCVKGNASDLTQTQDPTEIYGKGSRCFMAGGNPKCYNATCDIAGATITVSTNTSGTIVNNTCTSANQNAASGSITCPASVADFCTKLAASACPNDCSGFGLCLIGGTCFCIDGYTGADCSNNVGGPITTVTPPKPSTNTSSANILQELVVGVLVMYIIIK
jgi:hypothetical protein